MKSATAARRRWQNLSYLVHPGAVSYPTGTLYLLMPDHKDGDPEKTKEEYDRDNRADQLNPNNEDTKN